MEKRKDFVYLSKSDKSNMNCYHSCSKRNIFRQNFTVLKKSSMMNFLIKFCLFVLLTLQLKNVVSICESSCTSSLQYNECPANTFFEVNITINGCCPGCRAGIGLVLTTNNANVINQINKNFVHK